MKAMSGIGILEDGRVVLLKAGGEGSRGGKIIGHTSSGKPIYDTKHEAYERGYKLRYYNSALRLGVHHGESDNRKVARMAFPEYSAQDHTDAAKAHQTLSESHQHERYQLIIAAEDRAAKEGRWESRDDATHISGGVHPKFSEDENDAIREHAHLASRHGDIAYAHAAASRYYRKGEPDAEIEKAGEGSRGGKVIGHTSRGKHIYLAGHANYGPTPRDTHRNFKEEGYSASDHNEAAAVHQALSMHHDEERSRLYKQRYGREGFGGSAANGDTAPAKGRRAAELDEQIDSHQRLGQEHAGAARTHRAAASLAKER